MQVSVRHARLGLAVLAIIFLAFGPAGVLRPSTWRDGSGGYGELSEEDIDSEELRQHGRHHRKDARAAPPMSASQSWGNFIADMAFPANIGGGGCADVRADWTPLCGKLASDLLCKSEHVNGAYLRAVCPQSCMVCGDADSMPEEDPGIEPEVFEAVRSYMQWRPGSVTPLSRLLGGLGKKDSLWKRRARAVTDAFNHSWTGYRKHAWGLDELRPLSEVGTNSFGGVKATVVDALDTMLVMGWEGTPEYIEAREAVESLSFDRVEWISVFETTIRSLGGLLSAHDLSGGDPVYLKKAVELGDRLLFAFNTSTGISCNALNLGTGEVKEPRPGKVCLAEVGSLQLEMIALSQRTNNTVYAEKAIRAIDLLEANMPPNGLFPVYVTADGRPMGETVSFGGMGDSYFEYLLKVWVQANREKHVQRFYRMYETAMIGMRTTMIKTTGRLQYLAGPGGTTMDHLSCFVPGMLALGAWQKARVSRTRLDPVTMATAETLMETCYQMYHRSPIGLAGENYRFFEVSPGGGPEQKDFEVEDGKNLQRPETVESLFYLFRITRKTRYREMGWRIFTAFERSTKVEGGGYSGLRDVSERVASGRGNMDDVQETFWMAETLKYLYLLFSSPELVPLDRFVFSTEAHPLKITAASQNPGIPWAGGAGGAMWGGVGAVDFDTPAVWRGESLAEEDGNEGEGEDGWGAGA